MQHHRHLLLSLALCGLCSSCDRVTSPPNQGVVVQQGGQTFQVSFKSSTDTNDVRIASRTDTAGGRLRGTEWRVPRLVLVKQPRWDGFSSEPPLSAQKACAIAFPEVRQRFPEISDWAVHSVYLRNLLVTDTPAHLFSFPDVWVYEVTFKPKDLVAKERFEREVGDQPVTQVVLLDGTIVQPRDVK